MSEGQADKIIKKHNKDMEKLCDTQEDERLRQEETFKVTITFILSSTNNESCI